MEQILHLPAEQLSADWQFQDPRLNTLLFRYRARNYPATLTHEEMQKWQHHRQQKVNGSGLRSQHDHAAIYAGAGIIGK